MISKNHIKYIQQLHSKKHRDENFMFIAEGVKVVTEFILSSKYIITEILALEVFIEKYRTILTQKNIAFTVITEEELKKISTQQSPNQVLAIVSSQNSTKNDSTSNLCLYLDDIRDPGNLGTIIRIADWFGITNLFCSKQSTELYNPKTIQASMGAILRVNVSYLDFADVVLNNPHLLIYGAVLNGTNIYQTTLKEGIIVIGNEANGISKEVLTYINNPITIPAASQNGSESLNAANACAIICAEFYRQIHYK